MNLWILAGIMLIMPYSITVLICRAFTRKSDDEWLHDKLRQHADHYKK